MVYQQHVSLETLQTLQTLDELITEYETNEHSALNANNTYQYQMSSVLEFLNTDTNILSNPFDPQDCTFHTFDLYETIVDHEPVTTNFDPPTIKTMIHHDNQHPTIWLCVHTLYDSEMDPFISEPYMEEEFPLHILQLFVEYATNGTLCYLEDNDISHSQEHETRSYWIKLPDNTLTPYMYDAIMYYHSFNIHAQSQPHPHRYPEFIKHHLKQKMQEIPMLYQYIREMWYYQYPLPE